MNFHNTEEKNTERQKQVTEHHVFQSAWVDLSEITWLTPHYLGDETAVKVKEH